MQTVFCATISSWQTIALNDADGPQRCLHLPNAQIIAQVFEDAAGKTSGYGYVNFSDPISARNAVALHGSREGPGNRLYVAFQTTRI